MDHQGTDVLELGAHSLHFIAAPMVHWPEVFRSSILLDAYRQPESPLFTDDASVVEANGGEIHLSEGLRGNIKLTTPADMLMAEALMRKA